MTDSADRLVHMVNQIARNFAVQGDAKAIASTADHIASFWERRMLMAIFARIDEPGHGLSPLAEAAVRRLRDHGAPAHQTLATEFNEAGEIGHSDAG